VPFVDLSDVRIYYQWDGPADKPVVLFSNGLGTNVTLWDGQIAELGKHFRVLRYDHRGHGKSSVPPGSYSIGMLSQDVLGLLDALGVETCSFCGLSMGGMVGQWLGANAAGRIRKLVLSSTAAKIGTDESWNARIALVQEGGMQAAIPLVVVRWFTTDFQKASPERVTPVREAFLATDPVGYAGGCAAVRDGDFRASDRKIGVPSLIVAGTHDSVAPPAEGRFLVDDIPGARFAELPAAHLSNVEARDQFNSAILDFLTD
jgi:3-oxoadipate enol-lactonase